MLTRAEESECSELLRFHIMLINQWVRDQGSNPILQRLPYKPPKAVQPP